MRARETAVSTRDFRRRDGGGDLKPHLRIRQEAVSPSATTREPQNTKTPKRERRDPHAVWVRVAVSRRFLTSRVDPRSRVTILASAHFVKNAGGGGRISERLAANDNR